MIEKYDFGKIESKWQSKWLENGFYKYVGKAFSNGRGTGEKFRKRFKTRRVEALHDVVLFTQIRSQKGRDRGVDTTGCQFCQKLHRRPPIIQY